MHALHTFRFILADWKAISALPDWQLHPITAFWLGLVLLPVGSACVVASNKWGGLWSVIVSALVLETVSQVFGRSLFKLSGDMGVWAIVLGRYYVTEIYGLDKVPLIPTRALSVFHSEALGVLRTLVNVCLFVIGTLGIAVTSNLIAHYFDTDLGQGTAWVQVGMVYYIAFGMAGFIIIPLFRTVIAVRQRLDETVEG